jgi:GNAT superfamily N-acetyltransferase
MAVNAKTRVTLRPARSAELALISDSWVRSFAPEVRKGPLCDPYMSIGTPRRDTKIAPNLWWEVHRQLVARLLEKAAVLVAVHPDHPTAVLGWIAFEAGLGAAEEPTLTLHFAWVRRDARREGIGSWLLETALKTVPDDVAPRIRLTHSTPDGEQLLEAARIA